jgi:16S rRNA (cytosine1402-N4)-methyltransferase
METLYHKPVLCEAVAAALLQKPSGVYLDLTLGGGGHFQEMLEHLNAQATAIGIDRDADAIDFVQSHLVNKTGVTVHLAQSPFSQFDAVLAQHNLSAVDGILLDLGVSSHQIDSAQRGFSYSHDAPLDMRMDQSGGRTAAQLLNTETSQNLARILTEYGDVTSAKVLSDAFVRFRATRPFARTGDIADCLSPLFAGRISYDLLARIFQALRIAVNSELEELRATLEKSITHLKPGGRIAVIAYHSGEDRIVKDFFRQQEKECICPPQIPRCVCGGTQKKFKRINRKAIRPTETEIAQNARSRSARLRIAERTGAVV